MGTAALMLVATCVAPAVYAESLNLPAPRIKTVEIFGATGDVEVAAAISAPLDSALLDEYSFSDTLSARTSLFDAFDSAVLATPPAQRSDAAESR